MILAQAVASYLLIVTTINGTETNLFTTLMTLDLCQAKIAQLKERNPKLKLRCEKVL
jgi:hypothetical protein